MDLTVVVSIVFAFLGIGGFIAAAAIDVSRGWAAEARRVAATNEALAQLRKQLAGAIRSRDSASAAAKAAKRRVKQLAAQRAALREELEDAEFGAGQASIVKAVMEEEIRELHAQLAQLKTEYDRIEWCLGDALVTRGKAHVELKAAKRRIKALAAQRAELRETVAAILAENAAKEIMEAMLHDRTHNF